MLQRIAAARPARRKPGEVAGVVLVPTRELAMQVAEAVHKYGKTLGASVLPLYGGAPMHQQIRALQRGVDVVVGTPGRVLDHIRRETVKFDGLQVLVLDEPRDARQGFVDLYASRGPARGTPYGLFSATMRRGSCRHQRHQKDPRGDIESEKGQGLRARVRQSPTSSRGPQPASLPAHRLETRCRRWCSADALASNPVETFNAHGQRARLPRMGRGSATR